MKVFYLTSDLCDLWREALFTLEPFLFLPLLQRQAEDARVHLLGWSGKLKGRRKEKKNILIIKSMFPPVLNISAMTNMRRGVCQNFAIFVILFSCDGGCWNKMLNQKSSISGDTNLTVCYLDAGRPTRWSYLCDRCRTPLHPQSQPSPSLQALDLNSSESTQ